MKVLQINTTVNTGSTGRITEDIGKLLIENGSESYIAFGRGNHLSASKKIKIGKKGDVIMHGLKTAIFDLHGFGSAAATRELLKQIEIIQPDVVGLHNLHGYYINIELLFNFLSQKNIPIVWTLYDCWSFTGHCTYFDDINCKKWMSACFACPKTKRYPTSYFIDNSKNNFQRKRVLFNSVSNMTIVVHSNWLKELVGASYLKNFPVHLIRSGVDIEIFRPNNLSIRDKYKLGEGKIIFGCASIWDKRKGLDDFLALKEHIQPNAIIVLAGLTDEQIKALPPGITGISRTEDITELATLYSTADVFVNPTWQDNFPTTNLEALACGTPVVTYNTGGSPEAVDETTGFVIQKGNVLALAEAVRTVFENGKDHYRNVCRQRAEQLFDKDDRYGEYIKLYESLLSNSAENG